MSENIGKLTTPSGDGARIEVHDTKINITAPLANPSNGNLSYLNDNKHIATILSGENNYNDGSCVLCFSNNSTNNPGQLWLRTQTGIGPNVLKVTTKPDELTINNKPIDTIYSSGNNYIKYTNGLLIQWGRDYIPINSASKTISFYIPYLENDDNAYNTYISSNCVDVVSYIFHSYYKSASDFTVISHLSDGTLLGNKYFKWLAIGRWK